MKNFENTWPERHLALKHLQNEPVKVSGNN